MSYRKLKKIFQQRFGAFPRLKVNTKVFGSDVKVNKRIERKITIVYMKACLSENKILFNEYAK